jgi:hypothetical protein
MISQAALTEYRAIYKKHFNADLSDDEAIETAARLLELIRLTYRPINKNEYDNQKQHTTGEEL